jgi:hypothetical protein
VSYAEKFSGSTADSPAGWLVVRPPVTVDERVSGARTPRHARTLSTESPTTTAQAK